MRGETAGTTRWRRLPEAATFGGQAQHRGHTGRIVGRRILSRDAERTRIAIQLEAKVHGIALCQLRDLVEKRLDRKCIGPDL